LSSEGKSNCRQSPRVRNWDRGFSPARVFPSQAPHLAHAEVPGQSLISGRPVKAFPWCPMRMLFAPDPPSLRPLQRLGVGDERSWRRQDDAHAHCVQSRRTLSPNPTESRSSVPRKKHERCVWCPGTCGRWANNPNVHSRPRISSRTSIPARSVVSPSKMRPSSGSQ